MAALPAGDGLSGQQHERLRRALQAAAEASGLDFVAYVGPLAGGRDAARGLLTTRPAPDRAVVLAVDPAARQVEIVTGAVAAVSCDDRACGLAAATMTSSFAAGDLYGGLRNGIDMLGGYATRSPIRHLDPPG